MARSDESGKSTDQFASAAPTEGLERGREAYNRKAWAEAFAFLSAADAERALDAPDLELLATAARLIDREAESTEIWTRAHHAHLAAGNTLRAIRCVFWLAVPLLIRGDVARGSGWLARAQRLLERQPNDCVERGYVEFMVALRCVFSGDIGGAASTFGAAVAIAERFADRDLETLARHGQARALINLGQTVAGGVLLDEVMVAVTAGEVTPLLVGDIYCSVIEGCYEMFDMRRAGEWTTALTRWCEAQPDLVKYRGQCRVRRAEILQLHGEWHDAMEEAERARAALSKPPPDRSIGAAFYRLAELHRLRGDFANAAMAYGEASRSGREPQPGLGLLRLAQKDVGAAKSAIRRTLDETKEPRVRARFLAACAEIMLAAGDVELAHVAAAELSDIAAALDSLFLRASSGYTMGAVLLAEGDSRAALAVLRSAWKAWTDLEAPYEAARTRVLMALTCRQLGDDESAQLELDAARAVFESLGAAPDLATVTGLTRHARQSGDGSLTARELQVLALVATGATNRAISAELGISEKTVARHISNIFGKLGVATRAAATALAYQRDLT